MASTVTLAVNLDKPVRRALDRSVCAQAIARLLWSQHRMENQLPLLRMQDAAVAESRQFTDNAEFITELTLSPDRAETAVLAMADSLLAGGMLRADNIPTIFEVSQATQKSYLAQAQTALNALRENVKEVPPDAHYRQELARLLDVISPKETI